MLSGNGRHRRPRQAPALLVAAGVTGSAIAIPLLGATGASAASGTTWDQVAECESGGSWSADTGNGYYGGLQLSQGNWEKYGGLDYAPSADQASRSQQIAVAEKVLAAKGSSPWSTCGIAVGLSQDSGSADVDTGLLGSGSTADSDSGSGISSGLSDSSSSSGSSSAAKDSKSSAKADATPSDSSTSDGSSADAAKSDDSDKSGQNGDASTPSETDSTSSGRHRGDTADESAADGRADDSTGRHASRGSDDSREAAPDAADDAYVVRPGDSLSAIADSLGLRGGWSALYTENEKTVGADPDVIVPGQSLALAAEPGEKQR
ncbi:LysM peptidoglycan-binding domain-containing protein [Streptomyces avermitilis]|uniref:LysM peptidoglycan-binding domain-containing protein n=1 Tax=Streptomyces avermitilis TaxID=33903 RepID=UPI0036AFC25F